MLHIGLAKGNIIAKSRALASAVLGIPLQNDLLHYAHPGSNFDFYLLKHRDIPELVANGIIDAGITSEEWLVESGLGLRIVTKLDWCDTRISLLGLRGAIFPPDPAAYIRYASEYPITADTFLRSKGITNFVVQPISGSSEGLVPSLFDYTIDCVQTGRTARLHNLVEIEVILESKTVLVCRPDFDVTKLKPLTKVLHDGYQ